MNLEDKLRALAARLETIEEHYKDHEPSAKELAAIAELENTVNSLKQLYDRDYK